MLKPLLLALMLVLSFGSLAKELYRAPTAGDSGTYYVLKTDSLNGDKLKVLTSRVGKGAAYTDFTELKVDCKTKQYFVLAGGEEDGQKEMPAEPLKDWSSRSQWTSLVPGSSKSDLVDFVCSKRK